MAAETPPLPRPLRSLGGWLALVVFVVGGGGALYLWWQTPQTGIAIPVPARDLPAYYQIQASDLTAQPYATGDLAATTLREITQTVGHYTLVALPQQQPVHRDQLGPLIDTALISDTVAIGIPATPAMVLDGNLTAGAVVDLMLMPNANITQSVKGPTLFENVLVLDVQPVNAPATVRDADPPEPFVIVLAIPISKRSEFALAYSSAETVLLTLQPNP